MSDHSYQGTSSRWPIVLGAVIVLAIVGFFALSSGTAVNTGDPGMAPASAPQTGADTTPSLIPEPAAPANGG